MHQVVPNRKKFQIYATIIIMVTIAIWLKITPTPQLAFFWADNLQPYHAKCITQYFNLGDHFPPHVCYGVSDMHLHILAISTT